MLGLFLDMLIYSYDTATLGATPFYTNDTNPRTISLNANQSQIVTFFVNATGDINSTHVFFVYANKTSNPSINNQTNKFNVTITS